MRSKVSERGLPCICICCCTLSDFDALGAHIGGFDETRLGRLSRTPAPSDAKLGLAQVFL